MQILIGILFILAVFAVWSWRQRGGRGGTGDAGGPEGGTPVPARRMAFRYKAGRGGLALIEDPREAAAIMMMEIARARGGPLTARQNQAIDEEIMRQFDFAAEEARDLTAHAAWVTNSAPLPAETMRRLSQMIVTAPQLGPKEVVDLDAMLVAVSEAEGAPTRDQLALLQVFRDKAGLKT